MMSLNCDNAMCYLTLAAQVMLDEDITLSKNMLIY